MKLSAVIITFNEERNIRRCIESLRGVADEIVVVDSYSTDNTRNIAESLGTHFIEHPFEGHIQQKKLCAVVRESRVDSLARCRRGAR